jgi:hypothetical protein
LPSALARQSLGWILGACLRENSAAKAWLVASGLKETVGSSASVERISKTILIAPRRN